MICQIEFKKFCKILQNFLTCVPFKELGLSVCSSNDFLPGGSGALTTSFFVQDVAGVVNDTRAVRVSQCFSIQFGTKPRSPGLEYTTLQDMSSCTRHPMEGRGF